MDTYESATQIRTHLRCDGLAFAMKHKRGALADLTGTVSTSEPHVVLDPYPVKGQRGVLSGETVRIESESGETITQRSNPRAAFRSLRRQLWWDHLDLCYFAGYALWGYVNAPFILARPDFEVQEIDPWTENGERWQGLEVAFPATVPAHSRVQRYYFDDRGLLRRNDYTAEVFGNWAKATHYCFDHRELGGLVVPTRRRAMPRTRRGKPRRQIGLVNIRIDAVTLE